jgi:hypothetical protein
VLSLTAGELRADRDGPVRLERLETEVADRRHDRGGVIDEASTLVHGQGLPGDVEQEPIKCAVDRGVARFRAPL